MLKNFFKISKKSTDNVTDLDDERLAVTVLLIRIAKSDYDYANIEKTRISSILERRYVISKSESEKLIQEAEGIEDDAADNIRFTKIIKKFIPIEDRYQIIELFWELVLADGIRDDDENGLLRILGSLLGVNDRDIALSRQKVQVATQTR
jgi:uncharacterized tellurite resistance protein B-like protein